MKEEVYSNFNSEAAEVFLEELSTNGYGLINIALDKVLDEDNVALLNECEEALIACEIIAAAAGKAAFDFPEDLGEWVQMFLSPGTESNDEVLKLTEKGADVIDRITASSELREFWEDNARYDQWINAQIELQKRLLS